MQRYLDIAWQLIGMAAAIWMACLLFTWMAGDKRVIQYELGHEGEININISNSLDETVPTFGMSIDEVVDLINELNKGLKSTTVIVFEQEKEE